MKVTPLARAKPDPTEDEPKLSVTGEFLPQHLETLWPGLDYKDGVVYMTMPALRETVKKREGKEYVGIEIVPTCVTSERERFIYDEETLYEKGFAYPNTFVLETEERWKTGDLLRFLDGHSNPPVPLRLFMRIRKIYESFVEFDQDRHYDIAALFIMFSYMFRIFNVTGYIHFHGTAQSGKSQNLSILRALAFNCVWSSSMTPAAIFRQVAGNPGTLCIDEAENFDGEKGSEIRSILLGGYKAGNQTFRAERKGETFFNKRFESFGPKALASINPLDPTFGSRSVVVSMKPATRRIATFPYDAEEWSDVRDQLYLWSMYHTSHVAKRLKEWESEKRHRLELYNRQWEVAQQFIVLADYIGGDGLADPIIDFFYDYYTKQAEANEVLDRPRMVLKILPRVLANAQASSDNFYHLKDILEMIVSYTDEDQREWQKSRGVQKILDAIGFDRKIPGKGGMRIQIHEAELRAQFNRRKLHPFDEDLAWLKGDTNYQTNLALDDTGPALVWGMQ
jgi:hypothetical protein